MQFFHEGGVIMYPLAAIALAVLYLAAVAWRRLRAARRPDPAVESAVDAILFWGVFGLVVGLIGTLVGVLQIAEWVGQARHAQAYLVWGGIAVALIPSIFAMLLLALAALAWVALRARYRRLVLHWRSEPAAGTLSP